MQVNEARLQNDLENNASHGRISTSEGFGRTVKTGSTANQKARDYFVSRLEDAGLSVRIDQVGNIIGRWMPETADPDALPVATGSHLDSVPHGGIFDGPLGVYAGIEAIRSLQESGISLRRPIEVVSFTGEEGSRFPPLIGSSVAASNRTPDEALVEIDSDGTTLKNALKDIGYAGDGVLNASEWDCWLELHIEQGPTLESAKVSAGVVSGISGITQINAWFNGEANHAGTTPMPKRHDALTAAAEFVLNIEAATNEARSKSESLVGTAGKFSISPGATNVIPGAAEVGVDIRDINRASMNTVIKAVKESTDRIEAERDVGANHETIIDIDPVGMSERCQDALRDSADTTNIKYIDIHSGAGHDTMHIASATDVGMLFAPSKNGISHSPNEWTSWQDCARATTVLADALGKLATETTR